MGDGRIFLKASATLPLMKIYGMSLIWAGSISLDSTFNILFLKKKLLTASRKEKLYNLKIKCKKSCAHNPTMRSYMTHWKISLFLNRGLNFYVLKAVFRIHDILGWIRIRILGSMLLTTGSGSGFRSGSWIRILLFSSLTFKMPAKN
jgi:hypothetical protein